MLKLRTVYLRDYVRIGGKKSVQELEPGKRSGGIDILEIHEDEGGSLLVRAQPFPQQELVVRVPATGVLNLVYDLAEDLPAGLHRFRDIQRDETLRRTDIKALHPDEPVVQAEEQSVNNPSKPTKPKGKAKR